jgi:EAL domain-containing protein (putative c-di-GMP-specific phosphodiesterase class I)
LEIEVTETAILADGEEVHRTMAALHAIGVRIALDDFGAGYSSLNHLRLYPFDKLKIDQAFVAECSADPQSAALINGVVYIGRALGMKVVAEGVETVQQQAFLRDAGVHAMQGYLFGKPAPVAELRAELTA